MNGSPRPRSRSRIRERREFGSLARLLPLSQGTCRPCKEDDALPDKYRRSGRRALLMKTIRSVLLTAIARGCWARSPSVYRLAGPHAGRADVGRAGGRNAGQSACSRVPCAFARRPMHAAASASRCACGTTVAARSSTCNPVAGCTAAHSDAGRQFCPSFPGDFALERHARNAVAT